MKIKQRKKPINIKIRNKFLTKHFKYLKKRYLKYFSESIKSEIIENYIDHLNPEVCSNDAFHLYIKCEGDILNILDKNLSTKNLKKRRIKKKTLT